MEILISEDDAISRHLLKKILTEAGHDVVETQNGQEAWNILLQRSIRMVITDWMMPELDGLALCRQIRSGYTSGYIYVVILTARDRRQDLLDVFQAGADDYILKPFDPEELKARVMSGIRVANLLEQSAPATKRNEETQAQMFQSEKMAAIGQLAAGVAHEINNPTGFVSNNLKTLSGYQRDIETLIRRYREMLARIDTKHILAVLDDDLRLKIENIKSYEKEIEIDFLLEDIVDLIGDCREGTDRIKKIIIDLKDFAHPGDDTLQRTDINRGIQSTLNVAHNEIKYKATVHLNLGALAPIEGYPQQLNQVFMNILLNAAHSIETSGDIYITTSEKDDMVEVRIGDTGCGIPQAHLTRVFDPFFTTKEVGKGTGLGMHIAYTIVQNHHGNITVESKVGKGTTFIVRLPKAAVPE